MSYLKLLEKERKKLGALDKSRYTQQHIDDMAVKYQSPSVRADSDDDDDDIAPLGSASNPYKINASGDAHQKEVKSALEEEKREKDGWDFFDSGSFKDGFDWHDPLTAVGGTVLDAAFGVGKGAWQTVEGISDLLLYGASGVAKLVGADGASNYLKKEAQSNTTEKYAKPVNEWLEQYSLLGDTSNAVAQGVGNSALLFSAGAAAKAAGWASSGITALTTGTTFASSTGSRISEAYNSGKDVSDLDAVTFGVMAGAVDAGTELLGGGIGKGLNATGISHGVGGVDDMLANKLTEKLTNQTVKNLAKYGIKSAGEGAEEVLAGLGTAVAKKLTYMSEEDIWELVEDENLLESFVVGTLSSSITQSGVVPGMSQGGLKESIQTGRDFVTGYTQNEQKVFDKEVENRISEKEANGEKVTNKDKKDIKEAVAKDMERGYISVETIEDVLGDRTAYDSLKQESDEFNTLYESEVLSEKQKDRLAELKEKNKTTPYETALKDAQNKNSQNVLELLQKDGRGTGSILLETYRERARLAEDFKADLSKYEKSKHKDAAQKTIESAIAAGANNTNRVHDLVDMAAQISADTGRTFYFKSGEQIKSDFVERQTKVLEEIESIPEADRTAEQTQKLTDLKDLIAKVESGETVVNGDINEDGITLNLDSAKPLNRTVGHEITHSLEKAKSYAELKDSLFAYAKSKGVDIDSELNTRKLMYEGITNANPEAELVSDLVGDYLFTDTEFVNNLSVQNRNVFQKLWDEVKYLYNIATAGSKEKRELARVQKAFEDAYRESAEKNTADGGGSYSIELTKTMSWSEQINGALYDGKNIRRNDTLVVGQAKETAVANEIDDKPLAIPQRVLTKAGSGKDISHSIKKGKLAKLDEGIKNAPITIFNPDRNAVVYVTNIKQGSLPVVAAFDLNAEFDGDKVHQATSIHLQVDTMSMLENLPASATVYVRKNELDPVGVTNNLRSLAAKIKFIDSNLPQQEGNVNRQYSLSKDNWSKINEMQTEVNNLTNSIREIEASEGYKDQMRKISEAVDSGNVDAVVKEYQRWLKESGYEALTEKRNALRDELSALRKAAEEADKNEALNAERAAIEKSGLSEADYFRKQAVKEFGYTPYFYDAGYIVANGKMLNFSGEKGQHFGSRGEDHRAIGIIYAETNGTDALNRFVNDGNIRISPESPGIDLSATTEPTKEQYATIKKFVYQYANKGYFSIDISDKNGKVIGSLEYENRIYPDRVISDLKHYYETGEIRKPSSLNSFRYSLSENSNGDKLSASQKNFFKDSKVVDENGNLKVMYHGTPNGDFTVFKDGTYFTDNKEYADKYQNPGASSLSTKKTANNPKTYEVYLNIKKPFDINDAEARRIYIEDYIKGGNAIGINPYLSDSEYSKIKTIDWTEGEDLREFLIDNGYDYDGLVLDEGATGGYGDEVKTRGTSYVVFSPEQVKNTDNKNPTADPDIRKSLSAEGERFAPSRNDIYGKDFRVQNPMQETVSEMETVAPVVENVAATENATITEDLFLDDSVPLQEEYESLIAEREDIRGAMDAYAAIGDTANAERLMAEYDAVQARIAEIEHDDADRFASLDDADAPPEIDNSNPEDVADNVPLTKALVTDLAKQVKAKLGIPNKRTAEVRDLIERYSKEEFPSKAHLYTEIAERFGSFTETQVDEELKGVKSLLRTYGINVDDSIKQDIADYGQFMRSNFGRIRFSKDGLPVDVAYQEFQEALPGYFPASVDVPTDQLMRIVEVANMDDTIQRTEYIDSQTLEEATDAIMNTVGKFKQNRKETLANKHGREAFKGMMESADQYAPPIQERFAPVKQTVRHAVQSDPQDIAPVYDTSSGQQAFMPDAEVPKKITRGELHESIVDNIKTTFREKGFDFDEVLKKAKDLSTFATVDNTPQRVMEKALGYKQGQLLGDLTVNKVAQNETEGIKWLNSFTDRKNGLLAKISKQYGIKPGSKASAAAQMYAEGFYVGKDNEIIAYGDAELAKDFPKVKVQENIKGLAKDPRIRQIYDETLAMINESRTRNAYPEIPRLDNYFLHFRAMDDTFSRLGLPFNPNDIRAKDLPTDLNGVTADLKPGQPYFASAMHRTGKRTSFDLLGGLEKYLTSAKNQIYHIDDIQTLRALRNFVADTYGQANGLEGIDTLTEEEAQERIEKVYDSHLSTFAKFLNEEANVLAGKTPLIDRGLEGIIGRRGITLLDSINRQVGANMVGYNISSSMTNFLSTVQGFAKTNKFDFVKGFAQFSANKVKSIFGEGDGFADSSPVMIRRKGAERFHRTAWEKMSDPGYALMGAVDSISTELVARAKYNELTRKGMDSQQAHIETDKWVSRLFGDRSLGQQPQLYNSKMLGLFTKFQLEVRNQLDSQFYDTIQEAKVSNEYIQNGLLRNAKTAAKVTSTFFQLAVGQHLFGKAFESMAGYNPSFDIISVLLTAFGFDDDEESEDTTLDNIEQAFLELLEDLPYTSTFTGGRIPISSALPIAELIKGEDQYGNEKSRWDTLKEIAPYYLLPGGYGQIKKTVQGLGMFSDEHPIAGSYTDSGSLRFPVEDTWQNRLQAGLFGQYASGNARDYFDNERSPLNEKQIQEFIDVGISIQDYWKYRDGLKGLDTLAEKADYIYGLDLTKEQKNVLINNIADRKEAIDMADYGNYGSFEEFDFAEKNPEKYSFLKENNVSYSQYKNFDEDTKDAWSWAFNYPEKFTMSKVIAGDLLSYKEYAKALSDIRADIDENGKTISGSAKAKKINYINGLDIDYGQKIILFRSLYKADDTYNYEIVDYLNNRDDISYDDMVVILRELGFTVLSDGTVQW